ncbi:hypothetical protein P280DRAFT_508965 [Massarina eburnea CBS 473.64]|uniref:Uncharacterized protein n=1 Tax=Massarina eburnea CBS 473.64 TaxID=1395130 RepID=A0A6A6RTZ6_9PLEO|nr:hypothetical protein P280DRAFT_508965 [Massarina eburnea CBS 473.64]
MKRSVATVLHRITLPTTLQQAATQPTYIASKAPTATASPITHPPETISIFTSEISVISVVPAVCVAIASTAFIVAVMILWSDQTGPAIAGTLDALMTSRVRPTNPICPDMDIAQRAWESIQETNFRGVEELGTTR